MIDGAASVVAEEMKRRGSALAVAESLTAGLLTSRLAAAPDASTWLRGGLVAYSAQAKQELLGVSPGPVVTERAVLEMTRGALRLFKAEVSVATTGVGGPDPEEGQPPGTVWIAVGVDGSAVARRLQLTGDPATVCRRSCDEALDLLVRHLRAP